MLFPDDDVVIRRDTTLKGLSMLFNPERLVERLSPLLPADQMGTPRVIYVRYKPRTSCIVSYRLEMDDKYVDIYGKAVAPDALDKLLKAFRQTEAVRPTALYIEDEAIAIFIFPHDRRMKVLRSLFNEETRRSYLEKMLPTQPQLWASSVEVLRYKPEQRLVGRLCINGNSAGKIKVFAPSAYEIANSNAGAFCGHTHLRIPQRIGYSDQYHFIVFEWMDGNLLKDIITAPAFDPKPVQTAGAALAELHSQYSPGLSYSSRHDESQSLLTAAADLGFIFPRLENQVVAIAKEITDVLATLIPLNQPIHGDFNSEQVLVHNDQAMLLDLDNAIRGDPAADLGLFLAHLEKDFLAGFLTRERLESVKQAIMDGYRNSCRHLPENVELYTAVGLLRIACDFHKTLIRFAGEQKDCAQLTESILARVRDISPKYKGKFYRPAVTAAEEKFVTIDPFGLAQKAETSFLAGALDPIEAEKQLKICFDSMSNDGGDSLSLRGIRVTRYKTGRRCVIEYDVEMSAQSSARSRITLVGKVHLKKLDSSTFSCVQKLWKQGFGNDNYDQIGIPEPIGIIPDYNMWLQTKVPGTSAIEILAGPDGTILARRIVDATHKLQQADVTPWRKPHTLENEMSILRTKLAEVSLPRPEWSDRINRILINCEKLCHNTPQNQLVCCHRDFYHEHVIVDQSRLYLLDFDLYCLGDPGLDTGNFIGHITEYALRAMGDPRALAHIETAMERRFAELYDERAYISMCIYKQLTLVRHIYLSTLSRERSKFTENLLELCEERFAPRVSLGSSTRLFQKGE